MNKEFIKYEQALALKELGFDEPCMAIYYSKDKSFSWHHHKDHTNNEPALDSGEFNISTPTYSAAFRWFREKHNLCGEVYTVNMGAIDYTFQIRDLYSEDIKHDNFEAYTGGYTGTSLTYEEAESACLDKLIEIVKNKQDE